MKERFYKNYLLTCLLVILAFNYVDRLALGLVLQDIKVDLNLSDTQLGLLSGIAFALFYSVMGIPIARWADRGNRIVIICTTITLWSAAVALCGLATSFLVLLLIRVAVAIGEAGCMPPAHSLIADHFTREERSRATARYMLGGPLSVIIGFFFAGWLNELYGWRVTFVVLGVPGLVLAVLVALTLREPRRRKARIEASGQRASAVASQSESVPSPTPQVSVREVCTTLWANRTFRHLLFCFSVVFFFGYGILKWQPTFFVRSFGLETGELGTWFAIIHGLGGMLGTWWGGELAARYAVNNESLQLRGVALAYSSIGVISIFIYLSTNQYWAFGLMALGAVGGATAMGPLFAVIQTLVPSHMRAMSIAIIYLVANFIGLGLGPLAAGALSDGLRPWVGEESLRYSLLILCPGYLWGGWHLWRASRTVTRDLAAAAQATSDAETRRAAEHGTMITGAKTTVA